MQRIKLGLLTAATAATLAVTATAQAAPVTVGASMNQPFSVATYGAAATVANITVAEPGANTTSPVTGAVIEWHMFSASGGPFKLRVLRPTAGSFLGAGSSAP